MIRNSTSLSSGMPSRSAAALLICLSLFLTACSEQIRPLPPVMDQPVQSDTRQAKALEAQGEPEQAALAWLELADQAPADESDYLLLRAADAWMMAGERREAEQILSALDGESLTQRALAWRQLIEARLALMDNETARASSLLSNLPARLPPTLEIRVQQLQQALQDSPQISGERSLKDLPEPGQNTASNIDQIIAQVRRLDDVSLRRLQQLIRSSDRNTAAWAALAVSLRESVFEPAEVASAALDRWQQRYRIDGLGSRDLQELAEIYQASFQPPSRVALLLPLTGALSNAGDLLQHGFLTAALNDRNSATVEVFDTGSSIEGARSALFAAREQRMTQIVGPVSRDSVQELAEVPGQTIPILALNQPKDLTRISLEVLGQFATLGLLPEDGAMAAAAYARNYGFQRALVLIEPGDLGARLASAFTDAFEAHGGEVGYSLDLPGSTRDYSGLLASAISRAVPDVIFLATGASEARGVKPQLKYIDADHIQVLATSQIYNGPTNSRSDEDLNGTWLTWTPWLLDNSTGKLNLEETRTRLSGLNLPTELSLFALGADAWGVLPFLELMRRNPQLAYPGLTGDLRINTDGHLQRIPALAEIRGGRPQPLILNIPSLDPDASPPDR